jgi:hypothetical protein
VTIRVIHEEKRAADFATTTVASRDLPPHELVLPDPVPVRFETEPPVGKLGVRIWHGNFELALSEPPGRLSPACVYDVRFLAEGWLPTDVFGWRPTAGDGVLRATLRSAASVRGVLVDADGRALGKGRIMVEGKELASHRVAADGRFVVGGIEPGNRVVFADVDHVRVAAKRFQAIAGEVVDIGRLVAQRPRRITGRVRDENGRAVGGAEVTFVTLLRGWTDETCTYSHVDGRFDFEASGVDGFLIVKKEGLGTIPAVVGANVDVVMPRPALLRLAASGSPEEVYWTGTIRWPGLHPEAVWAVGIPSEIEVAPGPLEIVGEFDPWRMGPTPPELLGTRTRTAVCTAGKTTEVVFER